MFAVHASLNTTMMVGLGENGCNVTVEGGCMKTVLKSVLGNMKICPLCYIEPSDYQCMFIVCILMLNVSEIELCQLFWINYT